MHWDVEQHPAPVVMIKMFSEFARCLLGLEGGRKTDYPKLRTIAIGE